MKTLQDLYTEIMSSDEQKRAFVEAAKGGKLEDYLRASGCEATLEDVQVFLKEKSEAQLSDEELDNAAGGGCTEQGKEEGYISAITVGLGCVAVGFKSVMDSMIGIRDKDYDGWLCAST